MRMREAHSRKIKQCGKALRRKDLASLRTAFKHKKKVGEINLERWVSNVFPL